MSIPHASSRAAKALAAHQKAARVETWVSETPESEMPRKFCQHIEDLESDLESLPGLSFVLKSEVRPCVLHGPSIDVATRLFVQSNYPAKAKYSLLHWFLTLEQTQRALAERKKNIERVQGHLDLLKSAGTEFSLLWFQEGDSDVRFDFDGKSDKNTAYNELIECFAADAYCHITAES